MSISETRRFDLYDRMRVVLGPEHAATLMEILPPVPASDLATKQDLHNTEVMMRADLAEATGRLHAQMTELRAELRGDMSELRAELQGDMSDLRADLRGEMSDLRGELRGEMSDLRGDFALLRAEFRASNRHTAVTIVAAGLSIWLTFFLDRFL